MVKRVPKKEEEEYEVEACDDLKPGQKFPTPTPGYADRVFYETLLRQRPDSEMAQEWCVWYGVLPVEEATKIHDNVLKRKKKGGNSATSIVSPAPAAKKAKKPSAGSKKKIIDDDAVDSFLQVGGEEGIGTTAL